MKKQILGLLVGGIITIGGFTANQNIDAIREHRYITDTYKIDKVVHDDTTGKEYYEGTTLKGGYVATITEDEAGEELKVNDIIKTTANAYKGHVEVKKINKF